MPDKGDDPLSSEDLIRKAKERLKRPHMEARPEDHEGEVDQPGSDATERVEEPSVRKTDTPNATVPPAAGRAPDAEVRRSGTPTPPILPPEPKERPWYMRGWVRFGGVALFALGFVLFSTLTQPERDETGEIVESGVLDVYEARVGDCLHEPTTETVEEFEAVPCGDSHRLEVYALVDHPDESSAAYPGETLVVEWGGEECYQRFEGYVGASWEASLDLDFYFVYPSEESWSAGDRQLLCAVIPFAEDGQLTGSMKAMGSPSEEERLGTVDLFDLSVGDCFDEPGLTTVVFDVLTKSCEGLHDFEVYALPPHPAGATQAFPGEDDLDEFGESMCGDEFGQSVETSLGQDTDLAFYFLWPTEESWGFGERVVTCYLGTFSGKQIVGSLVTVNREGWTAYCATDHDPTDLVSTWRVNDVVLDGDVSNSLEWSEAEEIFLPLQPGWGDPARYDPCETAMSVWFMNDDTWLYGLYHVDWRGAVDPDDGGGIALFRGAECCGVESDIGSIPASSEGQWDTPWDAHGWDRYGEWVDDLEATTPGTTDIEGVGVHDDSGYWFEWRKRLDSGDDLDWVLQPGQSVGNVPTLTWLIANFWDDSQQRSYEHALTMTLSASSGR